MQIIKYEKILSSEHIAAAVKHLSRGGVVIYPTDTLYGMGGNFLSPGIHHAIDRIKGRQDMPYSAAAANLNMIHQLVDADNVPPVFYKLYKECLPGPYTFLFNVSPALDPFLVKNSDKIGIRVPDAPILLKFIEILNFPLITTSVNRSGQPPLNDPEEILNTFSGASGDIPIGLLLDGGVLSPSRGSTIIDLTTSPFRCIRKGDGFDRLRELGLQLV